MNDYPQEKYGEWPGNPKGNPYDPERCAKEVQDNWIFRQCTRKAGHGDRGLFCKQHAKRYPAQGDNE